MNNAIRQCISCRKQFPLEGLIKLTSVFDSLSKFKGIVLSPNKYQHGRSAYICRKKECIKSAIKAKRITKMLRTSENSLNLELIAKIEACVSEGSEKFKKEVA